LSVESIQWRRFGRKPCSLGGNVTGVLQDVGQDVIVKQLQILRELVPQASRMAVVMGPHQTSIDALPALNSAAAKLSVTLEPVLIHQPDDLERAFATMTRDRSNALIVLSNPIVNAHPRAVVELAARHRTPTAYWWRGMVVSFGGLISYGVDWVDIYRRAAIFIDRIFKGAKPGDLPIEQPTKFELAVNAKTAKSLGLMIPPSLRRADHIIE
jgi:putative ABC transport system substrate-binding protein